MRYSVIKRKKLDECEKKIHLLEQNNEKLQQRVIQQEQELKRNSIRIFGIEEGHEENVEEIVQSLFHKNLKLKLNVSTSTEKCYRVGLDSTTAESKQRSGAKSNIKPRAIFVKFINYKDKQNVLDNRRLLKSSGVVIREELVKAKLDLVRKAIKQFNSRNVWTRDGRIFAIKNGKRVTINSENDLEDNN